MASPKVVATLEAHAVDRRLALQSGDLKCHTG